MLHNLNWQRLWQAWQDEIKGHFCECWYFANSDSKVRCFCSWTAVGRLIWPSLRGHELLPRRLGEQRLRALVKLQTTEAAADSIINEFCRAFHIKGQKAAPLLVCAVASKIERALQNYLLLPLQLKNLKIVAAPLFTSLIDWKELPPGGENDKMRFSNVTCLV